MSEDVKIPKIVHYCWFGPKEISDEAKFCIASWEKFLPDYEIKKWSEDNVDLDICPYVRDAYDAGMYAFVADYFRFWALSNYGGIYMDTDMELLKPLDPFLDAKCFMTNKKLEDVFGLTSGIIGAVPHFKMVDKMKEFMDNRSYYNEDGSPNLTPIAKYLTDQVEQCGIEIEDRLQNVDGFILYPCEYLCPELVGEERTPILTDNTHAIHHFYNSWLTPELKQMYLDQIAKAKAEGKGERVV